MFSGTLNLLITPRETGNGEKRKDLHSGLAKAGEKLVQPLGRGWSGVPLMSEWRGWSGALVALGASVQARLRRSGASLDTSTSFQESRDLSASFQVSLDTSASL
jgi:hypothetical protein